MKLFLKAIAIGAKDRKPKKDPCEGAYSRTTEPGSLAELNHLIDVAESSGLVVWHDHICFKSSFWKWGNRFGTINWGGYGSSYRPENEKYFKFQYRGDTVKDGKLVIRKGAKPLDAVKALVLPEADADGSTQKLMIDAGATVAIAGKGLKAAAILDAAKQKKCNFILTADSVPKGLAEALDKAAEAKTQIFTIPVGRLRPLLEKPKRAPVKRGPKAPPTFADKDDAKAFSKLKALLTSQKFEEIDHAITLLPAVPGACDKLLEAISLAKGITAWTNDAKAWTAGYSRPGGWGENQAKLPCGLQTLGESFCLAEMPKNDLFNSSNAKRYALLSVINAAPAECAAAKAIREGLVALYWKDGKLPPLSNFKSLRHLYLENCNGNEHLGGIASLVFARSSYESELSFDWILPLASLKRLDVSVGGDEQSRDAFLKKASFPALEELVWPNLDEGSPGIPSGVRDARIESVRIPHARLEELLRIPRFWAHEVSIQSEDDNDIAAKEKDSGKSPLKIVPVKDRGEPLSPRELASLKKLLRDDSPQTVMQGLKILRTTSPATIDALLGKCKATWGWNSEGELGESARLSGPFFDSLKRNTLGEAVRINLLSLAAPGCKPADEIRKRLCVVRLPWAVVPIDVSGFNGIRELSIGLDPSRSTEDWITGLEKLTSLQKLQLDFSDDVHGKMLKKALPLGFRPPESVVEMCIELRYQEIKVKLDFITVSPNLRKLTLKGTGALENIATLKGIDPSKLEELHFETSYSVNKVPSEDLTALAPFVNLISLSGSLNKLRTLKGISTFKKLRALNLQDDSLEDISELEQVKSIERLKLGKQPETDKGLMIGFLSSLPKLLSVDCGGHGVADPRSLLKFRPETAIKLTNLDYLNK